jgi:hypothetical protein
MTLKAPGYLVFLLSIALALAVLVAKFAPTLIPLLSGANSQFFALLGAYVLLVLGCVMRGL